MIGGWLRSGLVIAAVTASLSAASMSAAWAENLRVGFINPSGPPEFWLLVSATMQAAAAQLGIDVDIRYTGRSYDNAIKIAKDFVGEHPPPDFLVATNDVGAGGEVIKIADAAGVPIILLSNDLDPKDWAAYGEPRTKYRHWLGSIVPDHEGGGYGIAEAILTEAARIQTRRPLHILALTGDAATPASIERVHGLNCAIGVMTQLLGPGSVDLVGLRYLDWTAKTATASVHDFLQKGGPHVDALWAANDPMAIGAIDALHAAGYQPGKDVIVGGLNWNQPAIERVLNGEMLLTHGGHFLGGAWVMVIIRDYHDGRDFAEEDVRLQFPMAAITLPTARRFPDIGKIDWRKVDFTKFSKTRNPAIERYNFTPDAVLSQLAARDGKAMGRDDH